VSTVFIGELVAPRLGRNFAFGGNGVDFAVVRDRRKRLSQTATWAVLLIEKRWWKHLIAFPCVHRSDREELAPDRAGIIKPL